MTDFVQTLVSSITVGSLYALIALGYTMVYGILRFINFAHGDIVVLGAWVSYTLATKFGYIETDAPWYAGLVVLLCSCALCSFAGFIIERFAYRPFRSSQARGYLVLAALGLCIQSIPYVWLQIFGGYAQRLPESALVAAMVLLPHLIAMLAWRHLFSRDGYSVRQTAEQKIPQIAIAHVLYLAVFVVGRLGFSLVYGGDPGSAGEAVGVQAVVSWLAKVVYPLVAFLAIELLFRVTLKNPPNLQSKSSGRLNILITAIGVSLLLQNIGIQTWAFGASPRAMPNLWPNRDLVRMTFDSGTVVIGLVDVLILSLSAILMVALQYLVFHTSLGRAMRAISFNADTAALMGIPVDRVVSMTFVLGSALAAAAGFLFVMKYPAALNHPADPAWVLLGLKAFVAAVVGGIGSIRGAVAGGFVIAFVEQFGMFYIGASYRDVYVFGLLVLILLVKPTGILGSPLREKV